MSDASDWHVRLVLADGTVVEYDCGEEPPYLDEEDLQILERICDEAGRARQSEVQPDPSALEGQRSIRPSSPEGEQR